MASRSRDERGARAAADDQAVLAASGHLTDRDRYLARTIGEHRVLTTGQACALAFDNMITARHRLGVLVWIGVLRRFRPRREVGSAPWHYILGPVGAALLGAEDRDDRRWLPQVRADRQLALERSQRLAHLTGRNWFFISLARHARSGGGQLRAWLNEAGAASYHQDRLPATARWQDLPHPDGLGTWAEEGAEITFVLEYDTGTENLSRLTGQQPGRRGAGLPAAAVLLPRPAPRAGRPPCPGRLLRHARPAHRHRRHRPGADLPGRARMAAAASRRRPCGAADLPGRGHARPLERLPPRPGTPAPCTRARRPAGQPRPRRRR
jgi:hypothetical protein